MLACARITQDCRATARNPTERRQETKPVAYPLTLRKELCGLCVCAHTRMRAWCVCGCFCATSSFWGPDAGARAASGKHAWVGGGASVLGCAPAAMESLGLPRLEETLLAGDDAEVKEHREASACTSRPKKVTSRATSTSTSYHKKDLQLIFCGGAGGRAIGVASGSQLKDGSVQGGAAGSENLALSEHAA